MALALITLGAPPTHATAAAPAPAVSTQGWSWPWDPRPSVERGFEAPESTYGAGHRGIDLLGAPGTVVRAVAPGVVTFAGTVAGVETVTVDHGTQRSTYQPVASVVAKGAPVLAGEPLGRLLVAGSHCWPRSCLHLGRRVGPAYADPLALLVAPASIRLVPPSGPPPLPADPVGPVGTGGLSAPVAGPVSSPFGMRVHPITGIFKLHDGTDFAVPCGTPAHVAAAGQVIQQYTDPAYGNRVVVEHDLADRRRLTTTYNHLSRALVRPGQLVGAGETIGLVGATGYATGCHLHFMVLVDGRPTDPMTWL